MNGLVSFTGTSGQKITLRAHLVRGVFNIDGEVVVAYGKTKRAYFGMKADVSHIENIRTQFKDAAEKYPGATPQVPKVKTPKTPLPEVQILDI